MRLHVPQNGCETGLMKPISPTPSANVKRRDVLLASAGTGTSGMKSRSMIALISVAAEHALALPVAVGVERHELDEADDVRLATGQLREGDDFVFRKVAHGDHVDLDRRDGRVPLQLFEPGQHLVQPVSARDLVEAIVLQRVQADVDAGQTGLGQRRGEAA